MSTFEIVSLRSGIKSLRSIERQETFHPVTGPRIEANVLHVVQQRLVRRAEAATQFVIWDVGFGAAANVLAAIEALRETQSTVKVHSFDKSTAPLEFALAHAAELDYVLGHEQHLRDLVATGHVQVTPRLSWQLHLGDFGDELRASALPAPHAIFYDPYSPLTNAEMWTLEHFKLLRSRLRDDVPCLLTNYTRSTAVRVTLLMAGFYVGIGCSVGEKAETSVASNRLDLLSRPLDRRWLERVLISRNGAPLRKGITGQSPISTFDFEWLQGSPQFSI